ncbi:M3 family metallopeptidase [Alloacidobacterium sp.]|uniref:M3 family metallopeptidase n=1 Tax=Alloacidobacterium sp. TaxID=2951999 RepID=UPI002D43126B|nr:M3 family metallopeptidase [Alloacidobacterium sp.]HYK34916.1 M3 family metallopeptidase [Alloacidobacterium sp.]
MGQSASTAAESQASHPWNPEGQGTVDESSLEKWVKAALERHQKAIDGLLAQQGQRNIENTLRLYDDAIAELGAAGSQTALLDSVHPDKKIRDKAQALTQKIAEAGTLLALNQGVYSALNAMDLTGADDANRHYVERTLLQYRLAGVDKDEATRKKIKDLQDKTTLLSLTFGRNVQENVNRVQIGNVKELEGLPEDYINGHPPDERGRITLTTDYPDYIPVMTFARSADLRLRMFLAYNTRAYPANESVLMDLLKTRRQIANILGFETWADLATADQMMASASNMKAFLDDLDKATKAGAEREYATVLEFAKREKPEMVSIDADSRAYWYEQYRRAAYDFDSQSVRPYFPYGPVEKGVLVTAEKLFQVTFRPAQEADVWHESVSAWDVYDGLNAEPGEKIGRFYLDMHPREGKDKWFSAHPLIPGVAGRQVPEAALICNFPEAKDGNPGLMQYSDVVTFFHEFGHLMHAILGGQQKWAGVSGIATEGDFVEVPSQMLEEFFRDAKLLASFAKHYETGEAIPAELVEKMNRAGAFGRADWVRTQLFYTTYSLDTHYDDPATLNLDVLLQADYTKFLPYTWIDGNRMFASFTHLTGYSSNYYTYLYDKVIALDFFNQFNRANLLEDPVALKYRKTVLEPGGTVPGKDIVQQFLGREQSIEAFSRWIGKEFEQAAEATA